MAEYKTKFQSNLNWGETFRMVKKAPAVANRIFATLADATAYVNDLRDSATEGIRITVLSDSTESNNGVYYVKSIGDGNEVFGQLVKICRSEVAWFKGNAVNNDGDVFTLPNIQPGDMYLNTNTLDIFVHQDDGSWKKITNMTTTVINKDVPYYKLSVSSDVHPEFDETWVQGNADGTNIPTDYDSLNAGQVYLWTRFYDTENDGNAARYTVALVYSTLNLGQFNITQ